MERRTLKEALAALAKRPEERTDDEVALVGQAEPVAPLSTETIRQQVEQLTAVGLTPGLDKLQEQFAALPAFARSWDHLKHMSAIALTPGLDKLQEQIAALQRTMPPLPEFRPSALSFGSEIMEAQERAREEERREKEEQRSREVATLQVLESILLEFREQRAEIERQGAKIHEHEEELTRIRTGGTGRPSAMHLILAELNRRGADGKLADTQAEQALVLARWLPKAHPLAAPTQPKTITNNAEFRALYRQLRGPLPTRKRPK